MKAKYGDNLKLLFTDTDSLRYEITTDDLYKDMAEQKDRYDFSEYSKDHELYSTIYKKVIGKFKCETNGLPIREFVGLRSKMYAFKMRKECQEVESQKLKGVKKNVVKKEIKFENYYRSLMGEEKTDIQQISTVNCIRSTNHQIYSVNVSKVGINAADDKRYLLDHVNIPSHGHYKITED